VRAGERRELVNRDRRSRLPERPLGEPIRFGVSGETRRWREGERRAEQGGENNKAGGAAEGPD